MTNFKKSLFTGLALITMASAGTAVSTTQANAGGYGYSHGNSYGHSHYRSCHYKNVWRRDYYGNYYLKRIKVCY